MKIKIAIATIAALAVMPLAACSDDGATTDPEPGITAVGTPAEPQATPDTAAPTETTGEGVTSPEPVDPTEAGFIAGTVEDAAAARDLAVAHVTAEAGSEGVVIDQDLEDRRGQWDVDVIVGDQVYEVKVHTADGTARTDEVENADDDDRAAAAATVTIGQAIEVAMTEVNGILDDASWEDDAGGHWDIEIDREGAGDVEVKVHPETAEIISIEE